MKNYIGNIDTLIEVYGKLMILNHQERHWSSRGI